MNKRIFSISGTVAFCLSTAISTVAYAATPTLNLAQQFGISYLPFTIMKENKLIEKAAEKEGIKNLTVNWKTFGSGAAMNDALISGAIDLASSGIPSFLTLWGKLKNTNQKVKVVAGLNNIPVFLNVNRPEIESLDDFSGNEKIALPAVKVSLQAMVLQMAVAEKWGIKQYDRLDKYTVSMPHPDAMIALVSKSGSIVGHFGSPPYIFQELKLPSIHTVINSEDVLGKVNFNVIYAKDSFRNKHGGLLRAYVAALNEAMDIINQDKMAAAEAYIKLNQVAQKGQEAIYDTVKNPTVEFTTVPNGLMKFADFMHNIGKLEAIPASWKDFCFPESASADGS